MDYKKNKFELAEILIYILSVMLSLGFLIFAVYFIQYSSRFSKEDTVEFIQKSTQHIKFAIEEHCEENFITLQMIAALLEKKSFRTEHETFTVLNDLLTRRNSFVYIGIADIYGKASVTGESNHIKKIDVSNMDFFKEALAGNRSVSRSYKDKTLRENVIYYAIPLENNNGVINGVLFVADPEAEIHRIIDNSLFGGKGYAHIINNKGDYIIKSKNRLSIGKRNNIFDIPDPMDKEISNTILKNMEEGKSGYLEKAIFRQNRLLAYEPLNFNNWYVFYVVPEKDVSFWVKKIADGSLNIIITATTVFIFLILFIWFLNVRNTSKLEKMAFEDPLTHKPNMRKFLTDAKDMLKKLSGEKLAVCYFDIVGFKYLNDLFGRETGNKLLRYLSDLFAETLQKDELFARAASDIFICIIKYKSKADIEARFSSIERHLSVFPDIFSRGYKIESYCGVYLISEFNEKLSINDMIDRANTSQKEAKKSNDKKKLVFYSGKMREQKLWEAEVESKMEEAIENEEFKIYLQPKVDIQHKDKIMGMEALVRWASPQGILPPSKYIEIFEKDGFVVKLDRYMLENCCKMYKEHFMNGTDIPLILSVNVSRLGLLQPDFVMFYSGIKEKYGIPDKCIELEFTEGLVFENHKLFESVVTDLQYHGFLCSLDDFGAGYSSLNILKSLHVDILKLDRLFFQYGENGNSGRELVKNIIAMAKALNMKTVAEGVENEEEIFHLRKMGCNIIQGFVFAKPMPLKEFKDFLTAWNATIKK